MPLKRHKSGLQKAKKLALELINASQSIVELRSRLGRALIDSYLFWEESLTNKLGRNKMSKFSVHFIKSLHFTDAPLDGVFTGATPDGKIVVCPYSERMAIPQEMVFDGRDGDVLRSDDAKEIIGKNGIVRTVHGAYYLDINGAKELIENLTATIDRIGKEE